MKRSQIFLVVSKVRWTEAGGGATVKLHYSRGRAQEVQTKPRGERTGEAFCELSLPPLTSCSLSPSPPGEPQPLCCISQRLLLVSQPGGQNDERVHQHACEAAGRLLHPGDHPHHPLWHAGAVRLRDRCKGMAQHVPPRLREWLLLSLPEWVKPQSVW